MVFWQEVEKGRAFLLPPGIEKPLRMVVCETVSHTEVWPAPKCLGFRSRVKG